MLRVPPVASDTVHTGRRGFDPADARYYVRRPVSDIQIPEHANGEGIDWCFHFLSNVL